MYRNLLLAFALSPAIALAQVNVPAGVESVTSGGYWTSGGVSGRYRIIVVNSGFEAVTSRLFVQWVREPVDAASESEVVATVEPELPFGKDVASFSATLKPMAVGRVWVSVKGVVSRDPQTKVSAVLVAAEPGKVAP